MVQPVIAPAGPEDIRMMADWAAAEGWNPGLDDVRPFRAADPGGFLMARVDGVPAACISVVRYGDGFGFLGFYICHPDYRGRGIGWAVWQAGMARLDGCTVGLDGVVAQQDNYRKSGFDLAHNNIRHAGVVAAGTPVDDRLQPVAGDLIPAIIAFDRPCFPAPRAAFLESWLGPGDSRRAIALVDGGEIAGYGVIRQCREGHKIGPLFAVSDGDADLLFRALAATVPGETVILDSPVTHPGAMALARRHGLAPVFETARMYRGPAPTLALSRIYGITSFELG